MLEKNNWKAQKEVTATVSGIKLILWLHKKLGRRATKIFLHCIVFFYWLIGVKQRKFSKQYISLLTEYGDKNQITLPQMSTYSHFYHFSEALLDKLLCWSGEISLRDLNVKVNEAQTYNEKGILILGSHLGNIEVCRGLAELANKNKVHILIHQEQTEAFNAILRSLNPQSQVNLISIHELLPHTIIFLKECLEAGDIVTILADRLPLSHHQRKNNSLDKIFLEKNASFPKGPFILALLLQVPTFTLVAAKHKDKYDFYLHQLVMPENNSREMREENIDGLLQQYLYYLTHYTVKYPMQWYNFYGFWQDNEKMSKDDI